MNLTAYPGQVRLFLLLPLITFLALLSACSSLPSPSDQTVTIRWTDHDVPHIKAENYESLGFGYGYVLAQDRLCESAGRTIMLRGERSRYYGADGVATMGFLRTSNLNSDLSVHLRMPAEWVEAELNRLQPDTLAYIRGVTAGMNEYVNQLPVSARQTRCGDEPVPVFKDTDIVRSVMRFGVMKELVDVGPALLASASAWRSDKQALAANSVHAREVEIEGGFGSNGWAYGGDVTEGKGAMLLGNPHSAWERRPHMQRIYMHQAHLTIPGEIDVAGAAFLGVPIPLTGYNQDVAWTILDAATVSPYVLQRMDVQESDSRPSYRIDGEIKPLEIRTVSVEVLEQSGTVATRTFEFAYSELGLLYKLPEKPGQPAGWYAITNAGEQNASGLDQFMAVARAGSTTELIRAVEANRGVLSQLLIADSQGEVGYVVAGNVLPITDEQKAQCLIKDGLTHNPKIIDGSTRQCAFRDQQGKPLTAPPEFFPNLISRGIIHNTNNSYKYTEFGKRQPDHAGVFGFHFNQAFPGQKLSAGLRYDPRLIMSARRMQEISADGIVTAREALQVLFDNRNYAAETFLDDILALCPEQGSSDLAIGCATLVGWDRRNNPDSQGALLFHQFWNRVVSAGEFLPGNPSGNPMIEEELFISSQNASRLTSSLTTSVRELRELGFAADAAWGDALYGIADNHRIPLHGGSYQEGILNGEMPAPLTADGFPYILFGSAYIQRVSWQDGEVLADVLLSHGQQESVDSDGRTAQLTLFSDKQLYRLPFSEQAVLRAKTDITRILTPVSQ